MDGVQLHDPLTHRLDDPPSAGERAEADRRELIQRETRLLTHWDRNRNGVWDPDELEAYEQEVDKLRTLAITNGSRKQWFFELDGEVYGAARLTEFESDETTKLLLVCFDGRTGWVALDHVLNETQPLKLTVF